MKVLAFYISANSYEADQKLAFYGTAVMYYSPKQGHSSRALDPCAS